MRASCVVGTEADAFIEREIAPALEPGETMLAAGYLYPHLTAQRWGAFAEAASKMAAFAVLTPSRLLLIQTRIGAFAPLLENHGIQAFDRSTLSGVYVAGTHLWLQLAAGGFLVYQCNKSTSAVSTHAQLLERLPSVFGESAAAKAEATSEQKLRRIRIVAMIVLALLALAWGLYRGRR
jgi:hypothetical protein